MLGLISASDDAIISPLGESPKSEHLLEMSKSLPVQVDFRDLIKTGREQCLDIRLLKWETTRIGIQLHSILRPNFPSSNQNPN